MSTERIIPLNILDGYQVRWNAQTVARDVVQNFFDEVTDFRQVTVAVEGRTITVRGPSTFDLDYLRYIGATTKNIPERRAAGGFGEGFKVCALVLLRDFKVTLEAGSGAWVIHPELRPHKLGRELCYRAVDLPPAQAATGSHVCIRNASPALCKAFASAKDLFVHPDNPRLQKPLFVDAALGVGVYHSDLAGRGRLFYRRQDRGNVTFSNGAALTFSLETPLPVLEGQRDRRDLRAATPLVMEVARKLPDAVLEQLIRHLRKDWVRGGGVLTALLRVAAQRGLKLTFPPRWYARTRRPSLSNIHAEARGYRVAVSHLGSVGMPCTDTLFGAGETPRSPTVLESVRMKVAEDLYVHLAGEPPVHRSFLVRDIPQGLHGGRYSRTLAVDASWLAAPFLAGVVPLMSCLARVGMGTRARNNGDRLTALIEGVLKKRPDLAPFQARWDRAPDDAATGNAPRFAGGEPEGDFRMTARLLIHAPPGFPPALRALERARRVAAEVGLQVHAHHLEVSSVPGALWQQVRGVPAFELHDKFLWLPRGARKGFYLRPLPGGALEPSDEDWRAVFTAEKARLAHRPRERFRRSFATADKAVAAWLRKNDPPRYRVRLAREACGRLLEETDPSGDATGFRASAKRVECQRRIHLHWTAENLEEACAALVKEVSAAVDAMSGVLERVLAHVPREHWNSLAANLVAAELKRGGPDLAAFEARVESLAAVLDAAAREELDEDCRKACVEHAARSALLADDGGNPAARANALTVLADAVRLAQARHGELDENGEAQPCYTLGSVLGPPAPVVPSTLGPRVKAAWDAALAEGRTELEAAQRCLDVVEKEYWLKLERGEAEP